LCDELGDLLFQVVFHARMAEERGWFNLDDVIAAISDKLLRRHPHVFAGATVSSAAEQTLAWERHKQQERGEQDSVLDGVPRALPALTRACKLQQRASRVGFDWPSIHGVSEKVGEELEELNEEIHRQADHDALADEAGDLLFAAVNLVRHAGVDPERALRAGNHKFTRRFRRVEQFLREAGENISSTDLDTLDYYWEKAKQAETSR
jgi:MazG family protein